MIFLKLDQLFNGRCCFKKLVQEGMLFRDLFCYLRSGGHFVQLSKSISASSRRLYEEYRCEIIFNLDQWFRRRSSILLCGE